MAYIGMVPAGRTVLLIIYHTLHIRPVTGSNLWMKMPPAPLQVTDSSKVYQAAVPPTNMMPTVTSPMI